MVGLVREPVRAGRAATRFRDDGVSVLPCGASAPDMGAAPLEVVLQQWSGRRRGGRPRGPYFPSGAP
eukprot:7275392-Lingulodinium_polyedra.AAC.1